MCLSKLIKLYTKKDKFYCTYLNEHDLKKKKVLILKKKKENSRCPKTETTIPGEVWLVTPTPISH